MSRVSNKFYVVSFFILLGISTAILLIASTAKTPLRAWGGYLDVGIVVLIAFCGVAIRQRDKSTARYEISHQVAVYLFPFVLMGMWLYRALIDFNIFLPGLAWRIYFFFSIMPHSLNLWEFE